MSFIIAVLCCLSFNSYADQLIPFTWQNKKFYYDNNKYVIPANKNEKKNGIPVIMCAKSIGNPNEIPVAMCCTSVHAANTPKGHFELTPYQGNGCKSGELASTQCDELPFIRSTIVSLGSLTFKQAKTYCKTIQ